MTGHAQQPTASGSVERVVARVTAVGLVVATLFILGVLPALALSLLGLGYIAHTAR